jgi:hypothetical protein
MNIKSNYQKFPLEHKTELHKVNATCDGTIIYNNPVFCKEKTS